MISNSEVAFAFDGSGMEQEVISLNTVRMVKEKELEEVTRSVNFPYLNFRTKKMIGKIEKGVEKALKTAINKRKIEEKKPKGLPPGCEVVFTLFNQWYIALNSGILSTNCIRTRQFPFLWRTYRKGS